MKRVFLDENVDPRLAAKLSECYVRSIRTEGWFGVKNGELLRRIESDFDILVSHDRGLEHQQRWRDRRLGLVLILSASTDLTTYDKSMPEILAAIETTKYSLITKVLVKP